MSALPDTPVLETARLILRPLRLADAPAAQMLFPRWDIVRWLHAVVPWPYPDNGAEGYIRDSLEQLARRERFIWAICLKPAPDELIGVIELRPDDGSRDQRGFWLATEYQGRGLMTEAAQRVTQYAFQELGWPHLWLTNARNNIPSRRVKERQGARLIETVDNRYVSGAGKGEVWLLEKEAWMKSRDPYNLQRFVDAQDPVFQAVRSELGAGHKRSHWMWFVFPQLRGLGRSALAHEYGISGLAEATAYLQHPVLGPRLRTCTQLVNQVQGRTVGQIFGSPDDLKFHSCMTLFARATTDNKPFITALEQFFAGQPDRLTVDKTSS